VSKATYKQIGGTQRDKAMAVARDFAASCDSLDCDMEARVLAAVVILGQIAFVHGKRPLLMHAGPLIDGIADSAKKTVEREIIRLGS